ncbi:hypothetical protein M8J76_010747 [Diaphorina citri]|nr:hypothetical protein M8J75_003888 [Diaphorina citri]KAI5749855.1 hypothetical protein M8J76_010747 [Diaphorina citri]KAI5755378.1 hypothetical protein M8J77_016356 [Diaphorina citri]
MSYLHVLLVQIFLWYSVEAYYCEFGLCEADTYCCGNNICCGNVYSAYYFWFGVLFVLLLLASFFGLFKYCCTFQSLMERFRTGRGPYTKVPSKTARNLKAQSMDLEAGSPPSYSEATSLRN